MAKIKYEDDIIINAASSTRLTPNFKAKEYHDPKGSLYVHRDLVAGVQLLRDSVGKLAIANVQPKGVAKGFGVTVTGDDDEQTLKVAKKLISNQVFTNAVKLASSGVVVSVAEKAKNSGIKPVFAFDCGLQVVACYETQGDPYQQATGNFDGAGMSFGVIQFNFKSKTLQELFAKFQQADEERLQACFSSNAQYAELCKVITGPTSKAIAWGDSISTGKNKHKVISEWNKSFRAVGRVNDFRQIQMEFAYDRYGKLLMATLAFLEGLSTVRIRNHCCLTALFDMCIQQGGHYKATKEIRHRVLEENPQDEFTLTAITVEERAKKANPAYRADCLSRRLGILHREPKRVTLEGKTSQRSNAKLYLLRNRNVNGIDNYLHPPILKDVG